uniref:TonB-dependent receptor plug domain-containing protein n=1 Tax=Ningiella ruwaisensis TaxID=2364274 RepID=UPI00109FE027|nr:TonB-dependent receptor [Ningiella ruwaisensis]
MTFNNKNALLLAKAAALGSIFLQSSGYANLNNSVDTEIISISGSRTALPHYQVAGAISVIDEAQIKASGAISLSELLRSIPSVNISKSGPLGTLSELRLRGSESNHVLVLIDGVEINDLGQGGLIDLSHILLANIERVEILRGPQSAVWGSAAVGGIISITSKTANKNNAFLEGSVGSAASTQISAGMSNTQQKLSYSLSANLIDTDGENIAREGDEADGYRNASVFAKLNYAFSPDNRVSTNMRIVDYKSDFDETDFSSGLIADANNISRGEQLSFGLDWYLNLVKQNQANAPFLWSQNLSFQYSQQSNDNFANDSFTGSTSGEKWRMIYYHHFGFSNGHFNLGLEGVDEQFSQSGPVSFGDPNQNQSNTSLSFIADSAQQLTEQLALNASYRYDNNEIFDNASSYRFGINYSFSSHINTFTSVGKAVKNPSFTERFGFFPGTFLGNAELSPESSTSFEAGLRAQLRSGSIQVSWYQAILEDEILGFEFDPESGLFTALNALNDSEREGIELEMSLSTGDVDWALSYAYLDATEQNAEGQASTELRRARHSGSMWLSYNITATHQIYLQADYTGERKDRFFPPFPQAAQIINLDNYWLLSANYRYKPNMQWTFSLRVSNALDTEYEDVVGFSGESRRIFARARYDW